MSVHQPPCRTGSDHLDREVDAGDVENEGLEAFVARFIAEREEEARVEIQPAESELELRYAYGDR